MTEEELLGLVDKEHHGTVLNWLNRGDGVAVYQNMAMDSARLGHRKFVSFGSEAAQLETPDPPKRLPDIGGQINWAYQLEATVQRSKEGS